MALQNEYSFQTDGVVIIQDSGGGNPSTLTNVTRVGVNVGGERQTDTRIAAGDTNAKTVFGPDPALQIEVTIEMYDEDGEAVATCLGGFLRNTASGKNKEIVLRPLGTGIGLKEIEFIPEQHGMELTGKSMEYPTGETSPAATGTLTWRGFFDEEPAEAAQSA